MPEGLSRAQLGVVILAGGEASRLPGKLELRAGELPMIARVYRNVSLGRETYISCKATFPPEIDALLPCPMVVDSIDRPGPLGGLLSTIGEMSTPYVFAVGGDAPFIDAAFIDALAGRWQPGDEALVPARRVRGALRLEPLAAIYERDALFRAGFEALTRRDGALLTAIELMKARIIESKDDRAFTNVNTPRDYDAIRSFFRSDHP